jgi:hypothetical protein
VVMSKSLCNRMLGLPETADPFTQPRFKNRIRKHIHQMMQTHLLPHTLNP